MKHTIKLIAICALLLSASAAQADWKQGLKDAAVQKGSATAAEKLNLPTTAPADAKVYLISPKNGDTVGKTFTVLFGLSGAGVAPAGTQVEGSGHHHLLVDDPTIDATLPLPATDQIKHFGKGQTETTLTLEPGKHTLQLLFADWKHQPFNPSLTSDKITITVE